MLFYSPSDLIGVLIAIKTWTWLSHVEVATGPTSVIGARAEGVNPYPMRVDDHLVAIRRPRQPFMVESAKRYVAPMMGQPYEITGLFRFFDPWAKHHHAARICSSVVTAFELGGGKQLFNPDVSLDSISPAQLWQTAELATVWEKQEWAKTKRTLRLIR